MDMKRVGLGCLGFLVGGALGVVIGSMGAYGIASLITSSTETQAYLTVLIVPAVAFIGGLTVALTAAWLPTRKGPLVFLAIPGWLVLAGCVALAAVWSANSKPARVTVRNASSRPFHNLYLGSDFRRNQRVGELGPGETSPSFNIDLATPGTFSGLEGRTDVDGEYVRHRLTPAEASNLEGTTFEWVVGEADGQLTYRFQPAP